MADVKFLSTDEVAAILNLDKKTVQRMCKEGRITAVKQSDRKQSWWKIPEKAIGYCKICGKPFPITKERRVYCSDECVLEAKRAKSLAYWRKTHPPKALVPDPEPEERECEQLCMDLPDPLPFEPDPVLPPRKSMSPDGEEIRAELADFFDHLAVILRQ